MGALAAKVVSAASEKRVAPVVLGTRMLATEVQVVTAETAVTVVTAEAARAVRHMDCLSRAIVRPHAKSLSLSRWVSQEVGASAVMVPVSQASQGNRVT